MEHDIVHGLADMTTAIKLRPDHGENYSDRGDMYRADDQLDAALADYQKELELAATPVSKGFAKYDQALAYDKKGNTDLALSTLNEGMALVPESKVMFEERADIYINMGKFDLAVADLKKAADIRAKTAK
jgi:tetratricopeptide (TPR) repeat protein